MASFARVLFLLALSSLLVSSAYSDIVLVNQPKKGAAAVTVTGTTPTPSNTAGTSTGFDYIAAAEKALKFLGTIPALKNYTDLLQGVFDLYTSGLLDDVTIFVPMRPDSLYTAYKNFTAEQQQQVASYHISVLRYTWKGLRDLNDKEELFTLEGNSITKTGVTGGYLVLLDDQSKAKLPAAVIAPNLFSNSKFVVHGISRMLFPSDFTQ